MTPIKYPPKIPTKSNVTKLSVATFKRAPDEEGLKYWVNNSGLTLEEIAKSFFDQTETKRLYPTGYSNHNFVSAVYKNLFNREPDIDGWKYWENELDSGHIHRSTFILAMINGAKGEDAMLIYNKEKIGEYFAISGLSDNYEAKNVIEMVNSDLESVKLAKEYIDSLMFKSVNMRVGWSRDEMGALDYLNQIRTKLGLEPFRADANLHIAAINHSKYLIINETAGHIEYKNKIGYTGMWPWNRAIIAGYTHTLVSENYAATKDYKSNIDSLFTAIYHRLEFLNFERDDIGIGVYGAQEMKSYVYDMGNSKLREFCSIGKSDHNEGKFRTPCADTSIKLSLNKYNNYLNVNKNTIYVVYPVDEVKYGTFIRETPYPIPGYSYSGNPISISFNPFKINCSEIVVESFNVWDTTENRELIPITILDKYNDPNNNLKECDFAFFPNEREEFGHKYKAEFKYSDGSGDHIINWTFSITIPGGDLTHIFTVDYLKNKHKFRINRGEDYYIYLPPSSEYPSIDSYSYTYNRPEVEKLDIYDPNTIHIKISKNSKKGYINLIIDNIDIKLVVK